MGLELWGWVDIYKRHSHSNYIFCKFIQTLGGVMKLLFILLLGLGFSQTEVSQKVFEITASNQEILFANDLIPGYDLEWAVIHIVGCSIGECYIMNEMPNENESQHILRTHNYSTNGIYYYPRQNNSNSFYTDFSTGVRIGFGESNEHTIKLLVTAEFPEEDTGYIEDGFQFCLHEGANLVSYPCDNPVPVEESLPSGIENFVTAIIGEGQATTYNPALGWVGSLSSFAEGGGYWFKSNSDVCFEYDCVAN